jgi:large subunit ribosomal protein L1
MPSRGKKYIDATRRFDRARVHTPAEALALVKTLSSRNFDETVEAAFRLGVDPRKADQMIRGAVSLPNGTGKTPAPTSSGPTTSSSGSRAGSWTSISPSPPPT